jgi:hypothetical protein
LQDETLRAQLKKVRTVKVKGESLRKRLVAAAEERLVEASGQVQAATKLF